MLKSCILATIFFFASNMVFVAGDDILREKVNCSEAVFRKHFDRAWKSENISLLMELFEVVPTVISEPPNETAKVILPDVNVTIRTGDIANISLMDKAPSVSWNCDNSSYYLLNEIDVDFRAGKFRLPHINVTWWRQNQWHLWLVANIPGCDVDKGETIFEYAPPRSRRRRELHNVVFLVYKQPENKPMNFGLPFRSRKDSRHGFDIEKFANQHNLGWPVAGNFMYYIWR